MLLCTNLLTRIWTNTNLLNQHSGLIKPHPLFWYLKFNPSATKGREEQYHCLPPNLLFWAWQNKWFLCGCHSILKLISIKSVLPHVFLGCLWNYQGLLANMLTVTKSLHFHLNGAIQKPREIRNKELNESCLEVQKRLFSNKPNDPKCLKTYQ